jgi:phosphoserine aminotransferase
LISGKWSQAAANEAKKYHGVHQVNRVTDPKNLEEWQNSIADVESWTLNKDSKYFFYCQNESIDGIELD